MLYSFLEPSPGLQNLIEHSRIPSILLVSRARRVRSILKNNHPLTHLHISITSLIEMEALILMVSLFFVSRVRRVRSIFIENNLWRKLSIRVGRVSSV